MRQLVPHQVVPCESFAAIGGRNSTPLPLSARRRRRGRGTAETDPLAKTFRHRGRRLTLCFCSNSAPRRAHHSVRAAQPHAELLRAAVSVSAFTRGELRFATLTSRWRFSDRLTGPLRSPAVRRLRGEDQHPTSAVVSVRAPKRRARWRLTGRFQRNRSRAHDPERTVRLNESRRRHELGTTHRCGSRAGSSQAFEPSAVTVRTLTIPVQRPVACDRRRRSG